MRYTLGGLTVLFAWLLFSDFCFQIMELVIPTVLPITLKEQGATNSTIGLIVGTVASFMSLLLNPFISFRSDRHRGRLGRRVPYLIWSVPFISLFLVLTGFSHDLGRWFHSVINGRFGEFSRSGVIIATIGVTSVMFQFFNMFVRSVYYYLLNDVVPTSVIGRFYALFRVFDAAAGFVFNAFILKYAEDETSRRWIYISMAVLFLIAFFLMFWQVREGQYPPPEPLGGKSTRERFVSAVKTYCRECFSVPFYWWLFLGNAFYRASEVSIFNFRVLLAKDLGMNLEHVGTALGWLSLLGVVLYVPLGWVSDRIHASRLVLISAAVTFVAMVLSMFWMNSPASFIALMVLWTIAWLAYISAIIPLMLAILPRDRYGQFASANATFYAMALLLANFGGGKFIDVFGTSTVVSRGTSSYLAMFWWGAALSLLSFISFLILYRRWQQLGGRDGYVPPAPANQRQQGFEPLVKE